MHFYPRSPCGERLTNVVSSAGTTGISIHALLAESDNRPLKRCRSMSLFLSTLSLRRATWLLTSILTSRKHFYPRSPCGERHQLLAGAIVSAIISIHALLAESDETLVILPKQLDHFYPRSPCGERRQKHINSRADNVNFYPRSPCGERLQGT